MSEQNPIKPCVLLSLELESEGCYAARLDIEGSAIRYSTPGQYLSVAAPGVAPGYFAISNAPEETPKTLELLIKASGPVGSAITAVKPPGPLLLSAAMGTGFPLHEAKGKDLVLLTMGTGISALRPVIQAVMRNRSEYQNVTLLHGARASKSMPFLQEHPAWRAAQIEVWPVFSQQDGERRGRVQEFLGGLSLSRAVVFLSGSKEMIVLSRLALARHQVGPERIFTNY